MNTSAFLRSSTALLQVTEEGEFSLPGRISDQTYQVALTRLLLSINGITNLSSLAKKGFSYLQPYVTTAESASDFLDFIVEKGHATAEQAAALSKTLPLGIDQELGPCYGALWRFWPISGGEISVFDMKRKNVELPSDIVSKTQETWESLTEDQKEEVGSAENLAKMMYFSTKDQFNELLTRLKKNPTANHPPIFNANPEFEPFEDFVVGGSYLAQRANVVPLDYAFSVSVNENKELGIIVNTTKVPTSEAFDEILAFYCLLAHLLAREAKLKAKFVHVSGAALDLSETPFSKEDSETRLVSFTLTEDLDIYALRPEHFNLYSTRTQQALALEP